MYIIADAKKAGPILEYINVNGIDNKQFRQMLDKTQFVLAAVYPPDASQAQTQPKRFQLAAWGNYPVSGARIAMSFSKDWKKVRSPEGKNYWYSGKNGVSLVLGAKQAFIVIADSPVYPVSAAPGAAVPEGFSAFRGLPLSPNTGAALQKDVVLSCWIENPAASFNQFLRNMAIPIELPAEQFFISIIPLRENAQRYEALLQIKAATATQARALAAIISLARNFISPNDGGGEATGSNAADNASSVMVSLLFANPPVQDGNNLNIKTGLLSAREISLLFNIFSPK